MPGIEKILRGILRYQKEIRPQVLSGLKAYHDDPQPKSVMFTCMDSRVLMTRMLSSDIGDHFVVRNAGNMVPHTDNSCWESISTEAGALELGCVMNNIPNVFVCGHSDCKAMHGLYGMRDDMKKQEGSPLEMWLKKHGATSIEKFKEYEKSNGAKPLEFYLEIPMNTFEAYIDKENRLTHADQLSQINTLQQLENVASHPMLIPKLAENKVRLNAFWFDIHDGQFYMFSREAKEFLEVSENVEHLIKDAEKKYA